jgi:radical SAM superfamily enzyme YgiQ (UPF0313 family)
MKILVLNEPFVPDFCRTQRWAARSRSRVLRPPDWLAYATAVLERDGFDVELYDFPARGWDKAELKTLVREKQPRYVVLDSTTPSIYSDIECARIAKAEADCRVIMVGPHAGTLPAETLELGQGAVDVVARGEFDYTVRDVVAAGEGKRDLDKVPGISYLSGGAIRHTPDRPLIENLDELPFPAWHHLDIMQYYAGDKLYPHLNVTAGRGCPFRCIFCLWPQVMHGRRYRLRSAANVVDEMVYDLERWPRLRKGELFFEDDTFTANRARALEICREIGRRGLQVTWSANARANLYDLDLFRAMKAAGCRNLVVGFESANQAVLDRVKKGITVAQSREFIAIARKAGLTIHGCFVFGLPGDTRSTLEETLAFALKSGIDTVQFSGAIPFPGTEYYDLCKEEGILTARSWADWLDEGEQTAVVQYPHLSKKEINAYIDRGLQEFYFRPSYLIRFLFNSRSLSDLTRKFRGGKNYLSYLFSHLRAKSGK